MTLPPSSAAPPPVAGLVLAGGLSRRMGAGTRRPDAWWPAIAVDWPPEPLDPFHNTNAPEDPAQAEALV